MSARVPLAIAFALLAPLVACAGQEQVLGGGQPAPKQPATAPTTWTNTTEQNCPAFRPLVGGKCDTFDEHGAPIAPQCSYDNGQSICICATGGMWACFRAAPGLLSLDVCAHDGACIEGVGCATPQHTCTCGSDAKLRCRDRATTP